MRRLLTFLTVVGPLLAMSCGGGKEIKFADFHYTVTCHEMRGCVANVYDINDSDGNGSVAINQCLISRTGASPALAFNVSNVDASGHPFSIKLSAGFYDAATGNTMPGACNLTVTEGGTSYSGKCGPGAPSMAIPCQITGIRESLTPAPESYAQIEGDIVCAHMTNVADSTIIREVEAVSASSGHPFHFRLVFCDGAMPPGM